MSRRQINQGFFTKLYIGQDGDVARYELTETFRRLLSIPLAPPVAARRSQESEALAANPAVLTNTLNGRARPLSVLVNSFDLETTTTPDDLVRRGVKETYMVELVEALSNPCWETRRLLDMAEKWINDEDRPR